MKNTEIEQIRKVLLQEIEPEEEISETELMEKIYIRMNTVEGIKSLRLRERRELGKKVFNSIRKMDVLQEYLEDEEVTEIMVNGGENIFIEKEGSLLETGQKFVSKEKLEDVVQQIASKGNRIVNETSPILDVRLADGSRVNIVVPPVAIDGPVITIRKFPKEALTMNHLIACNAITEEAAIFLKKLVIAKYNIFISGGTGAGKTTFLNILSNYIPAGERIITIEDSAELQIQNQKNLVRLEAKNANIEGKNEITIRDLIKSALRMRPDRIIVGEIRDATAIDMLTAMNTGHDGSLSTGHANSPEDMMSRLETLVLMGMEIPLAAIRRQIASAIDIVVHVGRLRDKSRRILQIAEVRGVGEGGVKLTPLYLFEEERFLKEKIEGQIKRTGHKLSNIQKCQRAGVELE